MNRTSKVVPLTIVFLFASSMLYISTPTLQALPDPSWNEYHSYDEIESGLRLIEHASDIAEVQSIGATSVGRQIWAVKISDDPEVEDEDEPDILFVGLHHAREWISAEVAFYLADKLVNDYNLDIKLERSSRIRTLVENTEIWIVPVLNPDGLEYSRLYYDDPACIEGNSRYWRKNRRDNGDGTRGVDLDRNYGHHWGQDLAPGISDGSPDSIHDSYWGLHAFSESETDAIRDLLLDPRRDFQAVLSYHSFSQLILYPWGYTTAPADDEPIMQLLAQEMSDLIYDNYGVRYTAQQASDLYLIAGDFADWVYATLGIPALTIELPPEQADPWWEGFLLPENEIEDVCINNYDAALYLIDWFSPASLESCNWFRIGKDHFLDQPPISETIYITGGGYEPYVTYNIYLVNNVGSWIDGMSIPSRIPGTTTTVTSDGEGSLVTWYSEEPPVTEPVARGVPIWNSPLTPGGYDIVIDVNGNGVYDVGVDALDNELSINEPQVELSPPQVPMTGNTVFLPTSEALYVAGEELPPNTEVTICVIDWFDWGDYPIDFLAGDYPTVYASTTATTTSDGYLPASLVWWPPSPGNYRVWVDVDRSGSLNMGDCAIDYQIVLMDHENPGIWLSSSSGFVGEDILINGWGFTENDIVEISLSEIFIDGTTIETIPSPIVTDPNGEFSASFVIPDILGWIHYISARDSQGLSVTQSFAVLNIDGDFDVDGISDDVDKHPTAYSNAFHDFYWGGTTEGSIISRGAQILTITDEPHPEGVRIVADPSGGTTAATIKIFDIDSDLYTVLYVDAGDELVATSGSVTIDVISGTVGIQTILVGHEHASTSLGEGDKMRFEPLTITAIDNPSSTTVSIGGVDYLILPGESIAVNRPPVAQDQDVSTNEDTPRAIFLAASDIDGDALTYSINDGPTHGALSGTAPNVVYTPDINYHGSDGFTFLVNDGDLDSDSAQVTITVSPVNDAPVADAGGPYIGLESTPLTLDASGSSDPEGDALEYRWDFEDDGTWDTGWSSSPTASHTWGDDWTGSAKVEVSDGVHIAVADGLSYEYRLTGSDLASITINNEAPTVEAGPDKSSNEGDSINLAATFTDTGTEDTHTATINWGDGTFETGVVSEASGSGTVSGSHAYGDNGIYTVLVTLTDDDGGASTDTLTATVHNVAPLAEVGADITIFSSETIVITSVFSDPGWLDTHEATWDYDDGTIDAGTVTEENDPPDSTGTVTGSHQYFEEGDYVVTLTVTDDDGETDSDSLTVTVERIPIPIDIKPGSDPNFIKPKNKGVIPVSILNDDTWSPIYIDPALVDPETAAFGPNEAKPVHWELEDIDSDGDIDLTLHFNTQDTGIKKGDTTAILNVDLYDGTQITGIDDIKTSPR